jgi:hypothetical protein
MVIDKILDRKDGDEYNSKQFYNDVSDYGYLSIARAMDCGNEADVKRELCRYIDINEYRPSIKKYINAVQWI